MHYVPESAREFLPDDSGGDAAKSNAASGFHYRSAPIYLLTAVVGLLLGAELLIGAIGDESWSQYQII